MQFDTTDSTWVYELLAWVEANRKRVMLGAGALCLVILAVYLYVWQRNQTELAASRALLELRAIASSPDSPPVASASEFLKVADQYGSTRAGERALLLAAGDLFSHGQYAEAQRQFQKFLEERAGSPLAPIAALGVAASLDAQDKVDAALAAYQGIVSRYATDPVAERAKLATAALYEAKHQPEQALKVYDQMLKPATYSGLASQAAMMRERLLEKFPKLANPDQGASTSTRSGAVLTPAPATKAAPPATPAHPPASSPH